MNVMAKEKMTVDEFLVWAAGRPGKYELIGGVVQQMSPERATHVCGSKPWFGWHSGTPFIKGSCLAKPWLMA